MKENLKQSEIDFVLALHDPLIIKETLFPENLKACHTWSDEDCELVKIRNYQQGWSNYAWMLVDDTSLSKKENFKKKQLAGTCWNIGSRNTGKSYDFIQMDIPINIMLNPGDESCLGSATAGFLKKVSAPIISIMREHPFFQIFKKSGKSEGIQGVPDLEIQSRNGHSLLGRNEKIDSPSPGEKFQGLHYKTLYYEESSYQTEAGEEKRIDSGSSLGVIERFSGIPDLKIGSPLGKILYKEDNKKFICRLPQYCIAENSLILMSDLSTKKIQDIKIGDKIFTTTENKPHKLKSAIVTNKIFNGVKETVLLSNGIYDLYITSDHKMLTKFSPMYRAWKSYDDLDIKKHEIYFFKNYIINLKDYYEGVFLGFLETEGSFKRSRKEKSIGQKTEKLALEFILNELNIKYTKYSDKKIKDFDYFYLSVKNNKYIHSLYKKLLINKDTQLGFLAGCIYGDGCVHFNKLTNHRDIVLVQKNKCKIIEKVLKLANIKYSKQKRKDNKKFKVFDCFQYIFHRLEIPLCVPNSKKTDKYMALKENNTLLSINHKKVFIKETKKNKVWDLTTTEGTFVANGFVVHNCREDWDDNRRKEMVEKYNGESSMAYKLNVIGEIIEGAEGFWDILRLKKKALNKDRKIKEFDIDKKKYFNFKQHIIIDRLPAEQIYCCADIGAGARPTEIIIVFYDGKKYKVVYNITLNKLSAREQAKIFAYIYQKMGSCFIGIDATTDYGIVEYLKKDYDFIDNKHIFGIDLRKNIPVDFEKDEKTGRIKRDSKGKPIIKTLVAIDWAMQRLENLFYEGYISVPLWNKFFKEFSGFKVLQTGLRKSYGSSTTDDLHQAFQIFAITQWNNEFETLLNKNNADSGEQCLGIM